MKSFVRAALGILILVCSCSLAGAASPPQASRQGVEPVSVEMLPGGTVQLRRGARKVSLNLGSDIAGCKSRLYDPLEHVSSDADVRLETVDETRQGAYTYLVLLAGAPPNCNVQGECGAGEESLTLIWLKLDKDLKLAGKQAFAVDECPAQRSIRIEGKDVLGPDVVEIKTRDLPWTGDVLKVGYEEDWGKATYQLIYDRRNPDAGFRHVPVKPTAPAGS
jgi:hypothetical protein